MTERVLSAVRPGRDPLDLAVRLRGVSAATPLIAPIAPAPLDVGFQDNFWILDQHTAQLFQAQATLRLVTDHAYWFVESDLADRVLQPDLQSSAAVFETKTYPLIHRYFGSARLPSVDGDPHIVFFLGNVPGVAAYFSSADAYPRAINPRSNEHDMIYVNLNSVRPGQTGFDSTITHELQHLAQFAHCPSQEGWVDEGASELAMRVAGYEGTMPAAFSARPDIQLTAWSKQASEIARHYQAAYLFVRYVAERAGGWDSLPTLFAGCARGESLFSTFLARHPIAPDLDSLLADWAVANLLQDASVADGRYAYANGSVKAAVTGAASRTIPFLGSVPQYAANFIDLPTGAGTATFSADASVPLLPVSMDGGGVWWSNRGDNMDTRLTRRMDLSGVADAAVHFQAWYDLEDQFDYVYLSASGDGSTWQVLPGLQTTSDAATGNNYGPGWTGSTGSSWIDEEVDLTPFVGSTILLRFEYVTDQSNNGHGFAFKDLSVPRLGLGEAGAVEAAWQAEGWVRVDAPVSERWNLRLVRWTPGGVLVSPVAVGSDGTATFALDETATRSTLVLAPTAPQTLLPANYSILVSP
jgi:hypothetical protein